MSELEVIADVAQRITGLVLPQNACRDLRADGLQREIRCGSRHVNITRKVGGIVMRIDVPVQAYFGVLLSIFTGSDGAPFYRISMPHSDPDLALLLFEARDDRDIVAVWKSWANYFGVPKLLEREPGRIESGEMWIGAAKMGSRPLWRRRGGALAKRKPKLLNRRRNAHAVIAVAGRDAVLPGRREASFPPV